MSLVLTRLQNMRAQSMIDKWETRPSVYAALDLFMMETEQANGIITPELRERAEQSIGNTLQTPVINYDAGVTISNSRSLTIADDENTSQMVNFTFATYAFGFTMVPAMYLNNEISMQRDFDQKMMKYLYELADTLDTAALTALSTARTQVLADNIGGKYSFTGNVAVCPLASQEDVIGDLNQLHKGNDFYGPYHVVGGNSLESFIRNTLLNRGEFQTVNQTFQWSDKTFGFTNRLANDTGHKATGYAVNRGSVGMLYRFEREALLRTRARTGHEWDIASLPMLNLPCATYFYDSVGDFSAIAGAATADMDRVRKEHYGFAVDICFVTAYNSDPTTIASPILKFAVANS